MTTGYQPDFDIDRQYGEQSEGTLAKLLGDPTVECKRKRYADAHFYVEVAQDPGATGNYKASGINTTKADYWSIEIADTGIVMLVPTARLKAVALRMGKQCEERDGSNPTRGRLVSFQQLLLGPEPTA